jgi:hypothetical protein
LLVIVSREIVYYEILVGRFLTFGVKKTGERLINVSSKT